jgi:hypothetical protein
MVLGIAVLLVVGIAKLLGGSGDGSSGPDTAANVADTTPMATGSTGGAPASLGPSTSTQHHKKANDPATKAAVPSGPCNPSDVSISPSVPKPIAGSDITLVLDISSLSTPACNWNLSGHSIALKITSGNDLIWTSSQCPKAIPSQDVVVRQAEHTRVKLTWDARRSEPGCPVQTEWALPGTYHLHVAALAGRPQDVTFLLTAPTPAEVTKTAHPHQHAGHKKDKKGGQSG